MHDTGKQLLNLMFRPGETVCVSHNEFGYYSIPIENVFTLPTLTMVPPEKPGETEEKWRERFAHITSDKIIFAALNPIKGFRRDINSTAFRNFLVEMDIGTREQQLSYIKSLGLPYSACIFSGNKSLHFLISLDTDLPNEKVYRMFSTWIIAIANLAKESGGKWEVDRQTINPSRSIRVPGAMRDTGKMQELLEYKGPVKIKELSDWLNKYPSAKPQERVRKPAGEIDESLELKEWVAEALRSGVRVNRNKTWFSIGCEFALAGFSEDATIDKLLPFFHEEHDFREKEWESAVRQGFKFIYDRK